MATAYIITHVAINVVLTLANVFGWKKVTSLVNKISDVASSINAELPAK